MTSSTHSQENSDILTLPSAVNVPLQDGGLVISSSCTTFQDSHKPDKKKPRKWAGWTRQEEETFFHALRQVGKNFEKITARVRSKNKDQVRHYYYRLVRRMNKLLGPQLCLDAKNSKETVAAMLRWWSLLEKFSCSFTKLRVKPRRFKIFVETLENQLMKDRNKTRRKRCSQGESCLDTSSTSPNDARPGKLMAMDLQNSQKNGAAKVNSLRRNAGSSASSNKGDLPTKQTVRQKRGGVASAAYRRWEKAAMAGVSLVADAAEQMERTANEDMNGPRVISSVGKAAHGLASSELMLPYQIRDTTVLPSMKLKLQLFPIDEGTRKALEKDAHNPHLELTLSARKRISSVLEHLNRKWGNSTTGMGELMLLPYSFPQEDKATQQRWTARDTDASTADVYATVGSPSIFRLRYGWFSSAEVGSGMAGQFENQMLGHARDAVDVENVIVEPVEHATATYHISDTESSNDQSPSGVQSTVYRAKSMCGGSADCKEGPRNSFEEMPSSCLEIIVDGNRMSQPQDKLNLEMRNNNATFSAGDWADSLTTISVGDLLSEVSQAARRDCEQNPVSCDSFDAAIAGFQRPNPSTDVSHASIWNAEETCDAFSFQKFPPFNGKGFPPLDTSIAPCREVTPAASLGRDGYATDIPESGTSENTSGHNLKSGLGPAKEFSVYNSSENICTTDIYWPDSLGSFEIEVPSSGYQGNDLTFGESVSFSGLSRLIASSVDAFQNCSFFGMDKKEISAGESRGVSVLLGNKMGSED